MVVRVIAGEAKGLRLKRPRGIRPTSHRMRGAVFSMLGSLGVDWSRVLELYAGTGALGIEALSRGATAVDFVEQNPRCCAILRENLRRSGFETMSKVYDCSVRKALTFLQEPYTLILLDPPYASFDHALLEQLALLAVEGCLMTVEHSSRVPLADSYGPFRQVRSRCHGDSCVSIYRLERRCPEPVEGRS